MVIPRGSQAFWQPKLICCHGCHARWFSTATGATAASGTKDNDCPDMSRWSSLYFQPLFVYPGVYKQREREMRTGSECLLVHCCCCCCSLGPFVTAHRIMCFLLFPLFFAVFSLFHCAKNTVFFGGALLGGGLGVWGGGFWGGGEEGP